MRRLRISMSVVKPREQIYEDNGVPREKFLNKTKLMDFRVTMAPMVKHPSPNEPMDPFAPASGTEQPPVLGDRVGIERAFDVLRHHTVHTKGYVVTALKLIEEFGNTADKALLAELLQEDGASEVALSQPPPAKKKAKKK